MRAQRLRSAREVFRGGSGAPDGAFPDPTESSGPRRKAGKISGSGAPVSENRIEVAVATQPALFRDAVSRALDGLPELRVVPGYQGEEGIRKVRGLGPRVLLLDETGLEQRGIRTIRRLRRLAPATRVLVLATGLGKEARERAMAAGAGGLFEMQSDLATLVQAIRTVAAGEVWNLHPAPDRLPPTNSVNRADGRLTRRESDIADCVGRGLRNRQIAAYLNISPETVKTHLSNIFRKLELEGRIGLSALAQRRTGPENRRTPDSRGGPNRLPERTHIQSCGNLPSPRSTRPHFSFQHPSRD